MSLIFLSKKVRAFSNKGHHPKIIRLPAGRQVRVGSGAPEKAVTRLFYVQPDLCKFPYSLTKTEIPAAIGTAKIAPPNPSNL